MFDTQRNEAEHVTTKDTKRTKMEFDDLLNRLSREKGTQLVLSAKWFGANVPRRSRGWKDAGRPSANLSPTAFSLTIKRQPGQTLLLGSAPNSTGQEQNILERVASAVFGWRVSSPARMARSSAARGKRAKLGRGLDGWPPRPTERSLRVRSLDRATLKIHVTG